MIVRFEDLIEDTEKTMQNVAEFLSIDFHKNLLFPSWNSKKMEEVYPWGTVRTPSKEVNLETMNELSDFQKNEISSYCATMLDKLGYKSFLD